MLKTFEVSALALPVTDLILDKLQRGSLAEVRNRENRFENRLEPDRFALLRDQVHLQEPVIRFALNFDQVRDLGRRINLGEINALGRLTCPASEAV